MIEQFKILFISGLIFTIAETLKTKKFKLITYLEVFYIVAQVLIIVPCIYYFKVFLILIFQVLGITPLEVSNELNLYVQIFLMLFFGDLISYLFHRLFHTNFLWRLHAVHHSTREMSWTKAQIAHPIESILSFGVIYFLVHMFSFSMNSLIIVQLISLLYGFLCHSKINFNLGALDYLFISPKAHHLHHEKLSGTNGAHSNYASFFSIWDILFRTYKKPDSQELVYGTMSKELTTLKEQLVLPVLSYFKRN
jgi:sterol desaturase/sphingolipid hydroxylase (fatty acid hydroxylase superfamily)